MSEGLFAQAVKDGRFIVTAQCNPPQGADAKQLDVCACALKGSVSALYAPECEDGIRLSSLAACAHLANNGIEPIMTLTTRDHNRIALQSMILGAASMGISNVFFTAGRHQTLTSTGSAKGVFDLDPIQLMQIADAMRKNGSLSDGQVIDAPVELILGTDTNPFAEPVELNVIALQKAVSVGADFVITQPVFDIDKFNAWMKVIRERGLHEKTAVIASVMPLSSSAQAVSLAERYTLPDVIVDKLQTSDTGKQMAVDTVKSLKETDGVRGINLMGDDVELISDIIKSSALGS
ncbi:methylenetetrahydrofolate reductase [bacterium]|nr:methylenetetrahydrofolate reductase [bacterium]